MSGIEPPCRPWQGRVLPLNYIRKMAVRTRFELAISSVTGRHVNPYTTGPNFMAKKEGFEPSRQFPDLCPEQGHLFSLLSTSSLPLPQAFLTGFFNLSAYK